MTDYGVMLDRVRLVEEQEERGRRKMENYKGISVSVEPLLKWIERYVEEAKKGNGTKEERDNLLEGIAEAEALCETLGQGYLGFEPDDQRICVLGSYCLIQMKKEQES